MPKLSVDQSLRRAEAFMRKGDTDNARALYAAVLDAFPNNGRAKAGLTKLNNQAGDSDKSKSIANDSIENLIRFYNEGKFEDVVSGAQSIVSKHPSPHLVWNIIAAGQQALGKLSESVSAYEQAIKLKPDYAEAHYNMGNALQEMKRFDEAIIAYRNALNIRPHYVHALNNMANALKVTQRHEDAVAAYRQALQINPAYAEAANNMGNALKEIGKLDDAIAGYRQALEIKPDYAVAVNNLANTFKDQKKYGDAIEGYMKAIKIDPSYAAAYNNLGNAYREQGELLEALTAYSQAVDIDPTLADALYNKSHLLEEMGRLEEAIVGYRRLLDLDPDYAPAGALFYQLLSICDWDEYFNIIESSADLGIYTKPVPPFAFLSAKDDAQQQLERSKTYGKDKFKVKSLPCFGEVNSEPRRLKIGYFSSDIHDHATMYLISGLFRNHNRNYFEIFCYSYGIYNSGSMRQDAKKSIDHFLDVSLKSDHEIVELARHEKLDIAIDLKGYTQHSRSGIFQHRLAPVQINYLGYPGSMGVDFMDYIIADPVVIPEDQRAFYSENIIYLPHSYQPNDDTRPIAQTKTSRADFGLPEDAFVLCCFNNNYKISPREYDIWMRILGKVDKSVLWLLRSNKWAEQNLRKEAEKRGVDANRVVFADRLPHAEHLARHKHADLFIDTFNVNAHTTASDALWAGLPVVTKIGKQFAARVAASLLTAIDLTELITQNEVEYENLILDLARSPRKLKNVRKKLEANRRTSPLFDTKRYARNFDTALMTAFETFRNKKQHNDIWVME